MKKFISVFLVALSLLSLLGCAKPTVAYFTGEVLSVEGDTLLVRIVENGDYVLAEGEDVVVHTDKFPKNVKVGDRYKIYFNGAMTMSIPAQLGTIYFVQKC